MDYEIDFPIIDFDSNFSFINENTSFNTTGNESVVRVCSNEYCISDAEYLDMMAAHIFPTDYEWVLIIFHFSVFVIGLIGNFLVCFAVYRNHTMRTVTNYFIVNLAVADFLVILICLPPTVLWDVTETWFLGKITCKLVVYFQSVSVSVSVLTLTCISVDRWFAICHPLKFASTGKRARAAIALIWICSLILVVPELIVLDTVKAPLLVDTHYFTQCKDTWSKKSQQVYQIITVILLYLAPFALMSVTYYQIAKCLWRNEIPGASENTSYSSGGNGINTNSATEGQIRSRRKAAKMLIAVVILFGVCYSPVHLMNLLRHTVGIERSDATVVISLISHWLCYANSAVNPIIYNFMSGKFRREFRDAFACMCCRKNFQGRGMRSSHSGSYAYKFTNSVTHTEHLTMATMLSDHS